MPVQKKSGNLLKAPRKCMYICMYNYIYLYIHMYVYLCKQMYMYIDMYNYKYICTCLRMFIYGYIIIIIIMSCTDILDLSRHFSLSFIASGRSSGLHPLSSHTCCMYARAGHPAFARPYVGVHRSMYIYIKICIYI